MPVTAKFSEEFYDRLGHGVANEIVDWFNRVDLTYKTELKEHNELNFQRFDAKLEQRLAELRAEIAGVEARLDKKIESEIGSLRMGMSELKSELRGEMAAMTTDLIKWMFLVWSGTALTVIGVMVVLTQ